LVAGHAVLDQLNHRIEITLPRGVMALGQPDLTLVGHGFPAWAWLRK
jgi:hypothetical protein